MRSRSKESTETNALQDNYIQVSALKLTKSLILAFSALMR